MSDARFEDGAEKPLFLTAQDAEGLQVISALMQDAVFPITEMRWQRARRRFALLGNRFRWEDRDAAERRGRPFERVQTLLVVDDVTAVRSAGVDRADRDLVLSLLSLSWTGRATPGAAGAETDDAAGDGDPGGVLTLVLAGDGALALEADCLDVTLRDVTRPYVAPSGKAPRHGV